MSNENLLPAQVNRGGQQRVFPNAMKITVSRTLRALAIGSGDVGLCAWEATWKGSSFSVGERLRRERSHEQAGSQPRLDCVSWNQSTDVALWSNTRTRAIRRVTNSSTVCQRAASERRVRARCCFRVSLGSTAPSRTKSVSLPNEPFCWPTQSESKS